MNSAEHNLLMSARGASLAETVTASTLPQQRRSSAVEALRAHWPEYLMEAGLLGAFMVSACLFGVLYEFPHSPARQAITSSLISVTFTFFRLGKIKTWDAIFYMAAQFAGAALGVMLVGRSLMRELADPAVRYVVTLPGKHGTAAAIVAECLITLVLMSTVLYVSNHERISRFTGLFAGLLVATYITVEAPFSGMSMNPARTFGSGLSAGVWTGFWIYLIAPLLGMLSAAELYLWRKGKVAVKCCKLHHDNDKRCIFCGANGGFAS